jgi:uncharacterized protein with HEPN domain
MNRAPDYLSHMLEAAQLATGYVAGMDKAHFLSDKRTQQAAIMNLVIIGEAATKLMAEYQGFLDLHCEVPWKSMKGMRNRIAHGYFDINLDVVWDTLTLALPPLLERLPAIWTEAGQFQEGAPK